jgi:putative transposase
VAKAYKPWVATVVRTIVEKPDVPDPRPARPGEGPLSEAARGGSAPREARADLLACSCFPRETWRQVVSSNPEERLKREIRRRTDVVGIFPDRSSIMRLIGAVLMEQTDHWTEQRDSMGMEVLAKVDQALAAASSTEDAASLELPEPAMA